MVWSVFLLLIKHKNYGLHSSVAMELKKYFTFVSDIRGKSMYWNRKVWLILLSCIFAGIASIRAQEQILPPDSVILSNTNDPSDPLQYALSDTIPMDSLTQSNIIPVDSLSTSTDSIPRKPGMLEAPVTYQAKDSIVLTAGNMAYLYGQGDVKYQQIQLQADWIAMNMDSSVVTATYVVDSLGVENGYPIYTDGTEQIEAKLMKYNFKTRKAYSQNGLTQQGDGFLTATVTKKMADNTMNLLGGRYTTCDEHEHPHFYINILKAKTRPGKNIVSGPAYLVIEDVPLPIALPFAFFPFNKTYSSGIIMPTYGEETTQGFYLRDGGYYFALSDYVDLALRGEYYTKGSWGLSARTAYRKRYKYSGNFDAAYHVVKLGEKGFDDYNVTKAFKIDWQHSQDAKANPFRTFSASINFSTNQFDRNEIKGQALLNTTANTKRSSVNITQRFPNSPWNISASMNISQSTRDSMLSVNLPTLMISMSMTAPFKRKNAIGPERWYEKIKLSYTGNLQNSVDSKENVFFKQNLIRDWKNGMSHRIPVSATYSLFNYINITPSLNYQERWYTSKDIMRYDTAQKKLVTDTTLYGFYRVYDYNASISAGTTLYGFYKPWAIFGGFINTIRHRMEPSISFNMTPDFGNPKYGYWQEYSYINSNDVEIHDYYSPYKRGQLFGIPGRGKQGTVSFSVNNNIEAKVRSNQDSTGLKKISLIDNLSYNIGYNMAADSLNWSDSNVGLRLKLSKSYTLNLTGRFETYIWGYNDKTGQIYKVNTPRWKVGKGLGRLVSTGSSLSYTFDNKTIKDNVVVNTVRKLFGLSEPVGENKTTTNRSNDFDDDDTSTNQRKNTPTTGTRLRKSQNSQSGEYDDDGYFKTSIPWSFTIDYRLDLGYGKFNTEKLEYDYDLRHSLSFSGNIQPTPKWRINYNGNYDFEWKKISYLTLNVSREMHCFQMSASIVPVGYRKSYMFSIAVSSSLLKDLKYHQSSQYWNGLTWY